MSVLHEQIHILCQPITNVVHIMKRNLKILIHVFYCYYWSDISVKMSVLLHQQTKLRRIPLFSKVQPLVRHSLREPLHVASTSNPTFDLGKPFWWRCNDTFGLWIHCCICCKPDSVFPRFSFFCVSRIPLCAVLPTIRFLLNPPCVDEVENGQNEYNPRKQ